MIVTELDHIDCQIAMTAAFSRAIAFLRQPDIHLLSDGRVEIDGLKVFAIVQRYETLIAHIPKFEFHRNYIDIQYIASGEEVIGWVPANEMSITEEYDPAKDIGFGTVTKGIMTPVHLRTGQLAVLYPEDGHAPKLAVDAPVQVLKIVVKVALI